MATIKQTLDSYFLSFVKENGLESLEEKMVEAIMKAECEIDYTLQRTIDIENINACKELEKEIDYLEEERYGLEKDYKQLKEKFDFFEPKTLQDEFKIQWIKDNWDKIPSI